MSVLTLNCVESKAPVFPVSYMDKKYFFSDGSWSHVNSIDPQQPRESADVGVLGVSVGASVGTPEGAAVKGAVGCLVGILEGLAVGGSVGLVGVDVGNSVGDNVG